MLRTSALLLVVAMPVTLAACGGSDPEPAATATAPATTATTAAGPQLGPAFGSMDDLPGVLKSSPPWDANADRLQQRLRAIGLPALSEEGQVLHTHQHLNLFVDGEEVPVAADIGIAADRTFISPLHTHEPQPGTAPDGIMHVESPTQMDFTLGQFFAVWGVPLSKRCLGNECAKGDRVLRTWIDGKPLDADPTRLVLTSTRRS